MQPRDDRQLTVVGRPSPFNPEPVLWKIAAGESIDRLLPQVLPEPLCGRAAVQLNGQWVPVELWPETVPGPGDLVNFYVRPGSHGGGKDVFRAVLTIGLMLAAGPLGEAIALHAMTDLAFASPNLFLAGQALITGGILLAGSFAINALLPPPVPDVPRLSGIKADESATYAITGMQNQFKPWGVIPLVLGAHRMAPPILAKSYRETDGTDQYIRAAFCWGYGPIHVSSLRIGETPLSNFREYELKHWPTFDPATDKMEIFPSQVHEESLSIKVKKADSTGWSDLTIGGDWAAGMYLVDHCSWGSDLLTLANDGVYRVDLTTMEATQVLALGEVHGGVCFVASDGSLYAVTGNAGITQVYHSTDSGTTWSNDTCDQTFLPTAILEQGTKVWAYGSTTSGYGACYEVTGGTATAAAAPADLVTRSDNVAGDGTTYWAVTTSGIQKSTDNATWTLAHGATLQRGVVVAAPSLVVAVTAYTVYRYNGSTWTESSWGYAEPTGILRTVSGGIYVSTSSGAVYESLDNGVTFHLFDKAGADIFVRSPAEVGGSDLYAIVAAPGDHRIVRHVSTVNTRTTEPDIDEIVCIVMCPSLGYINDSGGITEQTVEYVVQYAPTGSGSWSVGATDTSQAQQTVTLDAAQPGGWVRKSRTEDGPIYFGTPQPTQLTWAASAKVYGAYVARITIDRATGAAKVFTGSPCYTLGLGDFASTGQLDPVRLGNVMVLPIGQQRQDMGKAPDTPDGYLPVADVAVLNDGSTNSIAIRDIRPPGDLTAPTDFAPSAGPGALDVTIAAGTIAYKRAITAASRSPVYDQIRFKVPRGQYDVRVTRITDDNNGNNRLMNDLYWVALQSFKNEPLVNISGLAVTEIRIKATEQLNGVLNTFNGIATALTTDYDPATDTWVANVPSSNPASHIRRILTDSTINDRALSTTDLYDQDFKDLWSWCNERGVMCDLVVDYDIDVPDLVTQIGVIARAGLTLRSGSKYGLVHDIEKASPRQVISPSNAANFKWSRAFAELPDAVRVRFVDAGSDYQFNEVIAYADGKNASNATIYETVDAKGVSDGRIAYGWGRWLLALAKYRSEQFSVTMDFEHLAVTRGDRVLLNYDVPKIGLMSGRIKQVLDDGANITGFVLTAEVAMESGKTYGVRVRHGDMTSSLHQVTNAATVTTTVTLTTPVPLGSGPAVGDLFVFGELGKEVADCLVKAVRPVGDLTAELTLVPYDERIYKADKVLAVDTATEVAPATDTIMSSGHGFENGDQVVVGTDDTLPGGLAEGTIYYIVNAVSDSFQFSLTSDGPAVDITTAGAGTMYVTYTLPDYSPVISADAGAVRPIVTGVVSDETVMAKLPDGTLVPRIKVTMGNVSSRDLSKTRFVTYKIKKVS